MTDRDASPNDEELMQMWREEGWWIIHHEPTGVTTQGESRFHALLMLADALLAYYVSDRDLMALAEKVFIPDEDLLKELRDDIDREDD